MGASVHSGGDCEWGARWVRVEWENTHGDLGGEHAQGIGAGMLRVEERAQSMG